MGLAAAIIIGSSLAAGGAIIASQQSKKGGGVAPVEKKDEKKLGKKDVTKKGSRSALVAGIATGVSVPQQLSTRTSGRGTLFGN